MSVNPSVSLGGHVVEVGPGAGGKHQIFAAAPAVGSAGGALAGSPCSYTLRIKPDHPNVHLKTKAHWIIGWVPPPAKGVRYRSFHAARVWHLNGITRYWGFVKFDGEKHHGWIDGIHLESHKEKSTEKPGSYEAYRLKVRKLIKRAWRYLGENHKKPVNAMFVTSAEVMKLYHNPIENEENLADTVHRAKNAKGFLVAVRYASDTWLLVHRGGGHEWNFLKASYKDVDFNPGAHERDRHETQMLTMKSIPPAWA
ncbi:MAG: hypothetical protein ABJE95_18640 [Byssovorax sp.]